MFKGRLLQRSPGYSWYHPEYLVTYSGQSWQPPPHTMFQVFSLRLTFAGCSLWFHKRSLCWHWYVRTSLSGCPPAPSAHFKLPFAPSTCSLSNPLSGHYQCVLDLPRTGQNRRRLRFQYCRCSLKASSGLEGWGAGWRLRWCRCHWDLRPSGLRFEHYWHHECMSHISVWVTPPSIVYLCRHPSLLLYDNRCHALQYLRQSRSS